MDMRLKKLIEETGLSGNAVFNCNLSGLSAINTGGFCCCLITVNKRKRLHDFLEGLISLKNPDIELFALGHATNILFNDGHLNIILIRLGDDFNYLDIQENGSISAGAALSLQKFIVETAKKGYDFSFLAGIPGTLGGAVAGNSGSAGQAINSLVKKIKFTALSKDKAGQHEKELSNDDYSYRKLDIEGMFIITDVLFDCSSLIYQNSSENMQTSKLKTNTSCNSRKAVFDKIRENIKKKKQSQPLNTKNAGCFFKNPAGSVFGAGKLIDDCGLKGFRYGGAQISKLHANFIINAGNASSKDIYTLSAIIRDTVMQKYGIALEYEVRLAGF
jgi:UDP-N-acetylmuramate dehydrogenase